MIAFWVERSDDEHVIRNSRTGELVRNNRGDVFATGSVAGANFVCSRLNKAA